ncbi:uncharacterized protein LOC128212217 [Mya arenaria]|uniref:uncharacterized protein LOC128212217 n=1 Tax=Mya arenaria TaxID=6604 RepID=UPI0022E88E4B|nr:uncharacterized protein LOC128212217 [Mya arenaria]XP_052773525.1 uncharacterized protein LOC128212217 [Mya arenaria]
MASERRPLTRGPRLSKTFPHRVVLVVALVLCLCACGSIVLGVICWANHLWGYYWGTGLWSGGVILFAGMFGIVSSIVKNVCATKTFMIISIFGCIVSLGMIALACGGLDSASGFFDGGNRSSFLTYLSHALYLGLGVLQLTLCVLSDGICVYYLFYGTNAELYTVANSKDKKHKKTPIVRKDKTRSSTGSEVPLMRASKSESLRSSGKRQSKSRSDTNVNNNDEQFTADDLPIFYSGAAHQLNARALHREEAQVSSPVVRSASFSTFGRHPPGPDQVSLIVHPTDDNASEVNTVCMETSERARKRENHYAQTLLFVPPLPIEEDEALPPYEVVDSNPYENVNSDRRRKRRRTDESPVTCLYIHRSRSLPVRALKQTDSRSKRGSLRTQVPRGTPDSGLPGGGHEQQTLLPTNNDGQTPKSKGPIAVCPLSRSADFLPFENETDSNVASVIDVSPHDVLQKQFVHPSDRIMDNNVVRRNKHSQSMKSENKRRLDRHRRAVSAEIKPNKDGLYPHEKLANIDLAARTSTSSLDGSNSSLFADNRIMPTKFSLRKPIRQLGMPAISSPVPVKPPHAAHVKSPPPKPPRTHSVTADDLLRDDMDSVNIEEAETVFANINDLTNGKHYDAGTENVPQPKIGLDVPKHKTLAVVRDETKVKQAKEPVAVLDSGPVLRCMPPSVVKMSNSVGDDDVFSSNSVVLPTSPVLKHPSLTAKQAYRPSVIGKTKIVSNEFESKVDHNGTAELKSPSVDEKRESDSAVYAQVMKSTTVSPTSPRTNVQRSRKLYFSFSDKDNVSVFDPSPVIENKPGLESEHVFEIENKVTVQNLAEVPESPVVAAKEQTRKGDNNDKNMKEKNVRNGIQEKEGPVNGKTDLRVRLPPVSPSERILQRKNLTSNIDLGNSSLKEEKKSPETNGARPKTTSYKHLFSPLPHPSKHMSSPPQKPDLRLSSLSSSGFDRQITPGDSKKMPEISPLPFLKSPKPPVFSKPTKLKSPAQSNTLSSGEAVNVPCGLKADSPGTLTGAASSPLHSASGQSDKPSTSSSTVTPTFSPSAPDRARSSGGNHQGVLTLPPPQHARHVPDQVLRQQVPVLPNQDIPAQPGNADEQLNRPLFSVLL